MKQSRHRRAQSGCEAYPPAVPEAGLTRTPSGNAGFKTKLQSAVKVKLGQLTLDDNFVPLGKTGYLPPLPSISISRIHEASNILSGSQAYGNKDFDGSSLDLRGQLESSVSKPPGCTYSYTNSVEEVEESREISQLFGEGKDSFQEEINEVMRAILTDREKIYSEQARLKREKCEQALAIVRSPKHSNKPKDLSLVRIESESDSGSQTERPYPAPTNHLTIQTAIRTYVHNPTEQVELLRILDANSTPKLSILMQNQQFAGLYKHNLGEMKKLYGDCKAPESVTPPMVRKCFKLTSRKMEQLGHMQVWQADAFTLS